MNVLSLFDGMSCGQIALNRAGIKYDNYYSSEIDKYAIQVTQKNFPKTIQLGDVTKVNIDKLPKIDLLMGGSPCQGFSFAGKQLNFDDPRSKLFWEYVRIFEALKPKYFLMENVRMKKEYLDTITNALGVEPILINSSLVSAQNRRRFYWSNIPNVAPLCDSSIYLKDILELDPDNLVLLSKSTVERFKGYGVKLMNGDEDKARCLSAMEYVKNGKQGNYLKFIAGFEKGIRLRDGKTYSRNFREGYRIYDIAGKAASLTARTKGGIGGHSGLYGELDGDTVRYRKLTPVECERLQTVPDNYTEGVSNTQRYKMLGNGWTVDVIAHIFKGML